MFQSPCLFGTAFSKIPGTAFCSEGLDVIIATMVGDKVYYLPLQLVWGDDYSNINKCCGLGY